jgi:hypothetical protein
MSDRKKQTDSSVVAKSKNNFADFARNTAGPVVIGEDGLPCEAYNLQN